MVKKSSPSPTPAWKRRPSASGMGDPLAQRALYFSAVTAGGRYTTAIAMAVTSLGSSDPTQAAWLRRMSVAERGSSGAALKSSYRDGPPTSLTSVATPGGGTGRTVSQRTTGASQGDEHGNSSHQ